MAVDRERHALGWSLLAGLLLWELAGQLKWVGQGALPAPSQVLQQAWIDRADYPPHLWGTVRTASIGLVIGNAVAVALGLLFVAWRPAGRLMAGVNITLFAMPAIALVPILVIALDGDTPRVVLAALSVNYPTMVATVLGLSQVDSRLSDLVRVYGGGPWTLLWRVRLRSGLPTLLAGLRVAAPAAVLGSLRAEFGSGGNAGLGTYLIGSLDRADPERVWGIGLAATASISALAYFGVDALARHFAGHTVGSSTALGQATPPPAESTVQRLAIGFGALVLPFVFWWACVEWLLALGVSEVVLRGPLGVFEHLALADNAADNLARLGQALAQTLPYTVLGRAAGLVVAAVLAVAGTVWPTLGRSLLPLSLVSQSMPLVALTPLVPGAHGNAVPRGVRHRRRRDLHPHPHDRGRPAAQARLRDRVATARSADAGHHPAAAGAAGDGSVVAAAGRLIAGQRVRPVFQTGVSGRLVSPPARQAPGGTR